MKPPLESWRATASALFSRKTALHVASSPTALFALGNTGAAALFGEPVGVAINGVAAAATISLSALESMTGKPQGMPFYVLGAVNAGTSASIIVEGYEHHLFDHLRAMSQETKSALFMMSAYANWSIGAFVGGYHAARKKTPRVIVDDIQLYLGVGDLSAAQLNLRSSLPLALGVAKAIFLKNPSQDITSAASFANKHVTPNRLYALGFTLGAADLVLTHPFVDRAHEAVQTTVAHPHAYAAVMACWAMAYLGMDKGQNKELVPDAKKIMPRGLTSRVSHRWVQWGTAAGLALVSSGATVGWIATKQKADATHKQLARTELALGQRNFDTHQGEISCRFPGLDPSIVQTFEASDLDGRTHITITAMGIPYRRVKASDTASVREGLQTGRCFGSVRLGAVAP